MKKASSIIIKALAITFMAATIFFLTGKIIVFSEDNLPIFSKIKKSVAGVIYKIDIQALIPSSLKETPEMHDPLLTRFGIIDLTNKERIKEGLSGLEENTELNKAAHKKLDDLFERQYFEHISPSGEGPSDIAKSIGYEFVLVGENLAMGNYEDNKELVLGWMNSQGHRENILNTRYREIGVAVEKGVYEGKSTWIAVQEFGVPLSDCPAVSTELKTKTDDKKLQVENLQGMLDEKKIGISKADKGHRASYNKMVRDYNELVEEYNIAISDLKNLTADYNKQVQAFNDCINK